MRHVPARSAFAPDAWVYVDPARPRPRDSGSGLPRAVLFDRDGTLTEDDPPYNGDPDNVVLRPGAKEAVLLLRARRIAVGVVSNQSGVGRGLLTRAQVESVADRIQHLLDDPLDVWTFCPHTPGEGCACRKPEPGMVLAGTEALGVDPADTVVIGDIGADLGAAAAAGAGGILVPTPVTRAEEIAAAPGTAPDLFSAVSHLLRPGPRSLPLAREVSR
ncbi:D-glycero-alpha-D-manno-heptose-1,7-bisphosphate 7-phosphatase [Cryptosporangium phraense]|uniref:D,D-heptose 1,7-bisphosphate phosphatase n=1 Tax=Cryptosporangium phraense TaxID=2593070 RepID=A0A545AX83_9ACTN|nr:HAD-IIIA family hydrolase [Cryptosporangium phraense]TQS45942.1 HAD-IIIA family hydrolase [Cryptosporangium phraense]